MTLELLHRQTKANEKKTTTVYLLDDHVGTECPAARWRFH
jgi:hypothetical protein